MIDSGIIMKGLGARAIVLGLLAAGSWVGCAASGAERGAPSPRTQPPLNASPSAADPRCDPLDREMREARGRGDDKTADERAQQVAQLCPHRRKDLLKEGAGGPSYRRRPNDDESTVSLNFKLTLAPEDHVTWAALYFRNARLGNFVTPGTGELEVAFHVLAGTGPHAGKTFLVRRRKTLSVARGEGVYGTVVLTRRDGAKPFGVELETRIERNLGSTLGGVSFEAKAPTVRGDAPTFEPPVALRESGAGPALIEACPDARGRVEKVLIQTYLAAPHFHPLHLGAALDWILHLAYDPPGKDGAKSWYCDRRTIRFDRVELPAGDVGVPWP